MENLLYYPYINIPQTDWTKRVLLYYDKVASIVPQRYFYRPDEYDPFMKDMVRMELVEPVNPLEVLDNPWGISAPFIDYIKSKDFKLKKRLTTFQRGKFGRIHQDKFALNGPRIHIDKFDGEIFYQLEQAGLAVRQDGEWYIVEQRTANELMAFLASVIGGKLRYQPTTDIVRKRFTLKESKKGFQVFTTQNEKRELILNELIPFPGQLDLTQLKKFKEKHHDILKAFKNRIELIVLNPAIEEGTPLFVETINELKLRKEELSTKMNENKFDKIFYGTVCGMVGAGVGLATAGTLGGIIAGLPSFANAVYSALQIERAEDIFDQSGMKYLALADKRLTRRPANS